MIIRNWRTKRAQKSLEEKMFVIKAAHVRLGLLGPTEELNPQEGAYWLKHLEIVCQGNYRQLLRDVACCSHQERAHAFISADWHALQYT